MGGQGEAEPQDSAQMRPARVLVVDDEHHVARLIQFMLVRQGYKVGLAHDGTEALRLAAEFEPDAVVMDWMVPEPSGAELVARLRALPNGRRAPIMVLTAASIEPGSLADIDAHALKPIAPSALAQSLASLGVAPLMAGDRNGTP